MAGDAKRLTILVVEDDIQIRDFLRDYLGANGFRALVTGSADEARSMARSEIDLAVIDRLLPDDQGLSLCAELGRTGIPVIFLTALAEEEQRIEGLLAGADDYICKPFSPRELLARIHVVLRRKARVTSLAPVRAYEFGGWRLDLVQRKLFDPSNARTFLRSAEFNLLQVFCENAGIAMTRASLLDQASVSDRPASERAVDITVSRLRRQIEPDVKDPSFIVTVRHEGYLFTPQVTAIEDI